jgi:hypothetical protein
MVTGNKTTHKVQSRRMIHWNALCPREVHVLRIITDLPSMYLIYQYAAYGYPCVIHVLVRRHNPRSIVCMERY